MVKIYSRFDRSAGRGGGMSIQLQIEQMSGYLAARLIGSGTLEEALQQIELVAEHCKHTNNDKLLIDTTRYEVDVKISLVDRFWVAERLVFFACYGIKVAYITKPERMDPRKFGVMVAQNRGVNVDAFTDFQAAEEWLLR
jgi:hypothetical protein